MASSLLLLLPKMLDQLMDHFKNNQVINSTRNVFILKIIVLIHDAMHNECKKKTWKLR